jgi:flagellar basal body rod protein FlgC
MQLVKNSSKSIKHSNLQKSVEINNLTSKSNKTFQKQKMQLVKNSSKSIKHSNLQKSVEINNLTSKSNKTLVKNINPSHVDAHLNDFIHAPIIDPPYETVKDALNIKTYIQSKGATLSINILSNMKELNKNEGCIVQLISKVKDRHVIKYWLYKGIVVKDDEYFVKLCNDGNQIVEIPYLKFYEGFTGLIYTVTEMKPYVTKSYVIEKIYEKIYTNIVSDIEYYDQMTNIAMILRNIGLLFSILSTVFSMLGLILLSFPEPIITKLTAAKLGILAIVCFIINLVLNAIAIILENIASSNKTELLLMKEDLENHKLQT